MDYEAVKKRLKDAINYLASIGMIDSRSTTKAIAADLGRNSSTIGAARAGDKRYLTKKFINDFCSYYQGIISPDWILEGTGMMVTSKPQVMGRQIKNINLMSLPKEKLVAIINKLITMYKRQQEIIRVENNRFTMLLNEITSEVTMVKTKERIDEILAVPGFYESIADAINRYGNKQLKQTLSGADKKEKEEIIRSVFNNMPEEEIENLFSKVLEKFDSIDVISDSD